MVTSLVFILAIYFFFKNKKGLSLFLFIGLITGGFWILGIYGYILGYPIQSTDFAILYVLIILLYQIISKKLKKPSKIFSPVLFFLFFLFIAIFIDYSTNGTSLSDIFRTTRHWFLLLFIFILPAYSRKDIFKALKLSIYVTIIEIVLFLTEPLTGKVLFSPYGTLEALKMTDIRVYGLIPPLSVFLFTWTFQNHNIKNIYKAIVLLLIFVAILITTIRSLVIGVFIIIVASILLSKTQKLRNKVIMVFSIFLLILVVSLYKPISNEFSTIGTDITGALDRGERTGNMSFRYLLTLERLEHILQNPKTAIFGIGFITEKNYSGQFTMGLRNDNGEIIQLDTADIAWSLFFLRLGLLGTFLYTMIYIKLLKYFFKNRSIFYGESGFHFLLFSFFLTLASAAMVNGSFFIIPALLYKLTKTTKTIVFK